MSPHCWLCGHPINDPPEIIGHWHATHPRVAHRHCLRTLGELDLELTPRADEGAGPGTTSHDAFPGRP